MNRHLLTDDNAQNNFLFQEAGNCVLIQGFFYYRPRTKLREGNIFTGMWPRGGGYGPREYGLGGRVSVGGGGVIILILPLQRGEEATSAGGIHPTKMLSCFCNVV